MIDHIVIIKNKTLFSLYIYKKNKRKNMKKQNKKLRNISKKQIPELKQNLCYLIVSTNCQTICG